MLLRRTLRTFPGQIGGPLLQMAGAVVFTHYLAPGELGVYALAWAAQELAYYGLVAWWSAYVQRYAADHGEDAALNRLNRAETALLAGGGFVQAVIACATLWIATGAMSLDLALALALFTVTRNLATHFATRARAEERDLPFTLLQLGAPGGGLLLGVILFAVAPPSAEVLIWAYGVAQALALAVAVPMTRYRLASPVMDRVTLRASWAYGAPLVIANLLEWGANHGVRLVVDIGLGLEAVGLTTVAWWIGLRLAAMAAVAVVGALFADALNRLRNGGPDAARARLADGAVLVLGLLGPLTAGVALTAPHLAEILVAEPYRAATAALLPFAMLAGTCRAFREHGAEQALMVFERPGGTVTTTLIEAVLTLVLTIGGLMLGGLVGALAGAALGSALAALAAAAYARRLVGYYVRGRDIVRIATATIIMSAVVWALPPVAGLTGLALMGGTGVVVYAAIVVLFWRDRLPLAGRFSSARRPA